MGKILDSVRRQVQEASEIQKGGLEMAHEAVGDITNIRDTLREVPQDVDDDILSCVERVSDDSTREATDFMNNDVHSEIERGAETGTDAAEIADQQAERSHSAASTFGQIAGIRFGEGASDARSQAETAAANFEGQSEEVRTLMEENEAAFQKALADVMG